MDIVIRYKLRWKTIHNIVWMVKTYGFKFFFNRLVQMILMIRFLKEQVKDIGIDSEVKIECPWFDFRERY
jgi:hypothetical protein